jgi:hypothetical protein
MMWMSSQSLLNDSVFPSDEAAADTETKIRRTKNGILELITAEVPGKPGLLCGNPHLAAASTLYYLCARGSVDRHNIQRGEVHA